MKLHLADDIIIYAPGLSSAEQILLPNIWLFAKYDEKPDVFTGWRYTVYRAVTGLNGRERYVNVSASGAVGKTFKRLVSQRFDSVRWLPYSDLHFVLSDEDLVLLKLACD